MSKCKICGKQAPGRLRRCSSWESPASFRERHQRHIASEEWSTTRQRVMARTDGKCERCGGYADDVHHLNYCRLGNEDDDDLMALCRRCHSAEHQIEKMKKQVWVEWKP